MRRGTVNIIDLAVGTGTALALSWGAVSLQFMRQPLPRITTIEPAQVREDQPSWVTIRGEHFRYARAVIIGNGLMAPVDVTEDSLRVYFTPEAFKLPADMYAVRVLNGWGRGKTRLKAIEVTQPQAKRAVELYATELAALSQGLVMKLPVRQRLEGLILALAGAVDAAHGEDRAARLRTLQDQFATEKISELAPDIRRACDVVLRMTEEALQLAAFGSSAKPLGMLQVMVEDKLANSIPELQGMRRSDAALFGEMRQGPAVWVEVRGTMRVSDATASKPGDTQRDQAGQPVGMLLWIGDSGATDGTSIYRMLNLIVGVRGLPHVTQRAVGLKLLAQPALDGGYFYDGQRLASGRWLTFNTATYEADVRVLDRPERAPGLWGLSVEMALDIRVARRSFDLARALISGQSLLTRDRQLVSGPIERVAMRRGAGDMVIRLQVSGLLKSGVVWLEPPIVRKLTQVRQGAKVVFLLEAGELEGEILNDISVSTRP